MWPMLASVVEEGVGDADKDPSAGLVLIYELLKIAVMNVKIWSKVRGLRELLRCGMSEAIVLYVALS